MIFACDHAKTGRCNSGFQDRTYGQYMRVHNPTKDGWRCTVCTNETRKQSVQVRNDE
jgi:hypothetical protein